jgi:hypothetical protein
VVLLTPPTSDSFGVPARLPQQAAAWPPVYERNAKLSHTVGQLIDVQGAPAG